MPDRRRHRGPHPEDHRLFAAEAVDTLRRAAHEFCWLLDRGYAPESSLKLVGDRHGLAARQRAAVARASCRAEQALRRNAHEVGLAELAGRTLLLDGYNVLTTVEAALAGGVVLRCRDRTFRDMASVHGSFRRVEETRPAIERIGEILYGHRIAAGVWLLDRPVSNSGRLKAMIDAIAAERGWLWRVELEDDPDRRLAMCDDVVATADSAILDCVRAWVNLAAAVVVESAAAAWIVDLCAPLEPRPAP